MWVFLRKLDNNTLTSVVMDALLKFTAMHYMNKLCRLLFIVVLFAFIYAMAVVYVVTLLFIMWWLFRAYLLLNMFFFLFVTIIVVCAYQCVKCWSWFAWEGLWTCSPTLKAYCTLWCDEIRSDTFVEWSKTDLILLAPIHASRFQCG